MTKKDKKQVDKLRSVLCVKTLFRFCLYVCLTFCLLFCLSKTQSKIFYTLFIGYRKTTSKKTLRNIWLIQIIFVPLQR